jgi:hypothetical protein
MPAGGSRIFLVDGPINQAIEQHRSSAGQDHANHHKNEKAQGWPSVSRDE